MTWSPIGIEMETNSADHSRQLSANSCPPLAFTLSRPPLAAASAQHEPSIIHSAAISEYRFQSSAAYLVS